MEMRDAFLKNLSEEGGCDKYPFGKTDKRMMMLRIHGFYIKHNGDVSADGFCPYRNRLHCPFRLKIRMTDNQLRIWTAKEHDHNPANDTSKHIKVATAAKIKEVIAVAPIGNALFFSNLVSTHVQCHVTGIRAAHLHQELNRSAETALSPTKLRRRSLQKFVRNETKRKLEETSGLTLEDNTYSALRQTMQERMLDDLIHDHNHDPNSDDYHIDPHALICIGNDVEGKTNMIFSAVSTLGMLIVPAYLMQCGLCMQLCFDGTGGIVKQFCDLLVLGVPDLKGSFHPWAYCITPDHCKSVNFISAFYGSTLRAFNQVLCDLKACEHDDCTFCSTLDKIRAFEKVAAWMAQDPVKVIINGFDYGFLRLVPWTGAIGDNNAGW